MHETVGAFHENNTGDASTVDLHFIRDIYSMHAQIAFSYGDFLDMQQ